MTFAGEHAIYVYQKDSTWQHISTLGDPKQRGCSDGPAKSLRFWFPVSSHSKNLMDSKPLVPGPTGKIYIHSGGALMMLTSDLSEAKTISSMSSLVKTAFRWASLGSVFFYFYFFIGNIHLSLLLHVFWSRQSDLFFGAMLGEVLSFFTKKRPNHQIVNPKLGNFLVTYLHRNSMWPKIPSHRRRALDGGERWRNSWISLVFPCLWCGKRWQLDHLSMVPNFGWSLMTWLFFFFNGIIIWLL